MGSSLSAGQTVDLERGTVSLRAPVGIGRVLRSRYVIEGLLGAGGKGTVFKARDLYRDSLPTAEQRVALKVLHGTADTAERTLDSLRNELHCAQTLSHTNIVNVYELDRDQDVVFYTMELLEGELLSSVLERHRRSPVDRSQALQMIRQIGAGLQHAHERGISHGDLKPANIFVTRAGELRILDFGAARQGGARQVTGAEGTRQSVTLAYASCELLQGRAADPRDDLYAFACISYELLTGEHPFNRRAATVVRDFDVKAKRPACLRGRPWRALQANLAWHRAARSIPADVFTRRVTLQDDRDVRVTRLEELKAWTPPRFCWRPHAAALSVAAALVLAAGVVQVRAVSERHSAVSTAAPALLAPAPAHEPSTGDVEEAAPTDLSDTPPPGQSPADSVPAPPTAARRAPLAITVAGYHVRAGDRFVEIRVRRNRVDKDTSFSWWTEPATARQGVNYVHQGKAIQTFASERGSTRLYVKLIPDTLRPQRDFFYLAMTQPGGGRTEQVTRTPIWLPIPRGQLQAQR